jgi:hypothetical protein
MFARNRCQVMGIVAAAHFVSTHGDPRMSYRKGVFSRTAGLLAGLAASLHPLTIPTAQAKPGKLVLLVPAEFNLSAAELFCLSEDIHTPNLTGNGLSTGDIYTYSGAGSLTVYYPRGLGAVEPRTVASVSSGHVVGPDGGVLALLFVTQHLTLSASGIVTVGSTETEIRCAGR